MSAPNEPGGGIFARTALIQTTAVASRIKPASRAKIGTSRLARLEQASARLSEEIDPAARLRACLDFLNLPSNWPVTRLYPDAPEPEASDAG